MAMVDNGSKTVPRPFERPFQDRSKTVPIEIEIKCSWVNPTSLREINCISIITNFTKLNCMKANLKLQFLLELSWNGIGTLLERSLKRSWNGLWNGLGTVLKRSWNGLGTVFGTVLERYLERSWNGLGTVCLI